MKSIVSKHIDIILFCFLTLFIFTELNKLLYVFSAIVLCSFLIFSKTRVWVYIKRLFTVLSLVIPIGLYGTIKSVEVAAGILMILSYLKYSEIEEQRDLLNFYSMVFLYMAVSVILSDQVIYLFFLYFHVLMIFRKIIELKNIKVRAIKFKKVLLISSIFTILIYFVIPQVSLGNIFKFRPRYAMGGFSKTISPGAFRELIESDETQFYASFKDKLVVQPYWRGQTFDITDGQSWSTFNSRKSNKLSFESLDESNKEVVSITHLKDEDLPAFRLDGTYPFVSGKPLASRSPHFDVKNIKGRRYKLFNAPMTRGVFKRNLSLPAKFEKTRLYSELSQLKQDSVEENIRVFKKYFRALGLKYSLEVEKDRSGSMDRFLYEYKTGYCEHFASASALALRILGIPANVVGGFYGGRLNNVGGIVVVSGRNAHAWVEYWSGKKWVRIDPVSVFVNSSFLPENTLSSLTNITNQDKDRFNIRILDYFENLYLELNAFFFAFDIERQKELYYIALSKLRQFLPKVDKELLKNLLYYNLIILASTIMLLGILLPEALFIKIIKIRSPHVNTIEAFVQRNFDILNNIDKKLFLRLFNKYHYRSEGLSGSEKRSYQFIKYKILINMIKNRS